MQQTITYLLLFMVVSGFSQKACLPPGMEQSREEHHTAGNTGEREITYRVFENDSLQNSVSGWGYEVLMDNRPYIHQEHIPSIPGNMGFATKEDAEKTAQLVIKKIEKGIMPPSITPQELDSLGIVTKIVSSN